MSTILKPIGNSDGPTERTEPPNTSSVASATASDPATYIQPEGGFLELDGLRVTLTRPTYSNMRVKPENSLLAAMMTASNHGARWEANLSPNNLGWGHARNFATEAFYTSCKEADGMLWVDSDIVMAPWAVWKLLSNARMGYDFVSGVYFNRGNPWAPVIYEQRHDIDGRQGTTGYANVQTFPPQTMWEIDGCGFGFVYTSRRLIEAVHDHPDFDPEHKWFPDTRFQAGGAGEDFNFCKKVQAAGFKMYADTSILLGHEGDAYIYSIFDHKQAHDKVK